MNVNVNVCASRSPVQAPLPNFQVANRCTAVVAELGGQRVVVTGAEVNLVDRRRRVDVSLLGFPALLRWH